MRVPVATTENVFTAVKELKQEGKAISARSVRKKLGVGNVSQISTILKQVLNEEASSVINLIQEEDYYKSFNSIIVEAAQKVVFDKTKDIETEKTKLAEEVDECNAAIMANEERISDLESELTESLDKNKILEAQNQALQDEIKTLQKVYDEQLKTIQAAFNELVREKNESLRKLTAEIENFRDKYQKDLAEASKEAAYYRGLQEGTIKNQIVSESTFHDKLENELTTKKTRPKKL
jgi:chromosome segregation ATPase